MSRQLIPLLLLGALAAQGAIWPDKIGQYVRANLTAVELDNKDLWDEYGLMASERAEYVGEKGQRFTGYAYRMKDPTGAIAAFYWRRPADAKPSNLTDFAADNGKSLAAAFANYLIDVSGTLPDTEEFDRIAAALPNVDRGAPPPLVSYLPAANLVPNSERYILGPVSLSQFLGAVPPSAAAFRFGAEGMVGRYKTQAGEAHLAAFNYPTPNIARERLSDFEKIQGHYSKREGPMIVLAATSTADDAERLLAKIAYKPSVTLNENPNKPPENVGQMVIAILTLAGVLIGMSVLFGFFFGGFRVMLRRFGFKTADESFTSLHIGDK